MQPLVPYSFPLIQSFMHGTSILCVTLYIASSEKEICRLKWNWFFLILLGILHGVNLSSPLPSLHQFVTNPTAQQLSGTGREGKVVLNVLPHPTTARTHTQSHTHTVTHTHTHTAFNVARSPCLFTTERLALLL